MFKKVIIASGPTLEPIDPIRYISNRSSGKTGYYLAEEARKRGIPEIIFITGPTHFLPDGVRVIPVETAREMEREIMRHKKGSDVIVMAAAVCDFRSSRYHHEKIKKSRSLRSITLELIPNPDILKKLGARKGKGQLLVGFAAETENILANAQRKLQEKKLDLIVLNEISDANPAFGADENQVCLISRQEIKKLKRMPKSDAAASIWDEIERLR